MSMPKVPTRELIESKEIAEGRHYDFKRQVDLSEKQTRSTKSSKERFLDDIVAFLNGGAGHLIVGVDEEDGYWRSYHPLTGNKEKIRNQYLQVIQDNIKPLPSKVDIEFIDVDDGFVMDIRIPEHSSRPYQNGISGAFYTRSGSRNRILTVGEIQELLASRERMEGDLQKRFAMDVNTTGLEDSMVHMRNARSGFSVFQEESEEEIAPRLHFGILPRQHYDSTRPRYASSRTNSKAILNFDGGILPRLRGCSEGFEATSSHQRLFVGTDWYISGWMKHPFETRHGSPDLAKFGSDLKAFFSSLNSFLIEEGIVGPYCLMLSVDNLQEIYPRASDDSVGDGRPRHFERLDEEAVVAEFVDQLQSSLYG
ncbi:AlbA family DNA-binding domain-containing protein [Mesorhizobium sp. A623]